METAAPMETVEKAANRFYHRSHSAWKTPREKRSEFPTVPTAPAANHIKEGKKESLLLDSALESNRVNGYKRTTSGRF